MKWSSFGCKLAALFAGLLLVGVVGGGTALAYPPPTGSVTMTLSNSAPATGATVSISATVVNQAGVAQSGLECTFQVVSQPGTGATVDAPTHWEAALQTQVSPPGSDEAIVNNPLGFYVTQISWAEQQS